MAYEKEPTWGELFSDFWSYMKKNPVMATLIVTGIVIAVTLFVVGVIFTGLAGWGNCSCTWNSGYGRPS
jgi:cell division protein FtsX